ncbi:hypothetical protein ACPWT1_20660 [Ramlibacter sp. MMS24-I3-19]|uniref:hypothetical protein n=1 Tax=Ramlibacter sp. MMS24-I3-19 TaxID=3416606 RepID=UPI003CFD07B2
MCHLVREPKAFTGEDAGASVPPRPQGLRPRWAGAIAAVFLGGVALAAWVSPPSATSTPPSPEVKPTVAAVPAGNFVATPTAKDVEHGVLPVDDDVPTAGVKATSGGCHHAM